MGPPPHAVRFAGVGAGARKKGRGGRVSPPFYCLIVAFLMKSIFGKFFLR